MTSIKNLANKLVCKLDTTDKTVEIVTSGYKTIIQFLENGDVKILNTKIMV